MLYTKCALLGGSRISGLLHRHSCVLATTVLVGVDSYGTCLAPKGGSASPPAWRRNPYPSGQYFESIGSRFVTKV